MVNKLLITIGCIVIMCSNLECTNSHDKKNANISYHVYKIDSTGNFYVIYADHNRAKVAPKAKARL